MKKKNIVFISLTAITVAASIIIAIKRNQNRRGIYV